MNFSSSFFRLIFVLAILVGASAEALASDGAVSVRSVFQAIETEQWSAAQAVAQRSGGVVQALYAWQVLQREDEVYPFDRYRAFLDQFSDWPRTRKVRARAEVAMPDDLPASDVLAFYRTGEPATARGMLRYLSALEAHGRSKEAAQKLNVWFSKTVLYGTDQVTILSARRAALTPATLARRVETLLSAGEILAAQQLGREAGGGLSELVAARIAVRRDQSGVAGLLARVPPAFRNDPGLWLDRIKWRRLKEQNDGMADLLKAAPAEGAYDENALWTEHQILVRRFLDDRAVQKAYQISALSLYHGGGVQAQAQWLSGYIAFSFLKQPGAAFLHFEKAYKAGVSPLTRSRAAYWAGVASAALRYPDVAQAWFRSASAYPATYYGQLADLQIGGASGARHGPPAVSAHDREAFSHSGLAGPARLVCGAGEADLCKAFLNRMADEYEGQGGMVRQVVELAVSAGQMPLAIRISREAGSDGIDFADSFFPTVDWITDAPGVEVALLHAVIRQESAFDPSAQSSVGAQGLMQLMSNTATEVAHKGELAHRPSWLTDRPRHNVVLGSLYLKTLLERYDGSYALAVAAYNAGPSRVAQWLERYGDPRQGQISQVDFIERIPVSETRNYVQRVLEGVSVYRRILRSPRAHDFSHLAP